jgi:hypothetical protein
MYKICLTGFAHCAIVEGSVIPDWKKFISSGENIIRFLGDYIAKHIRQNSSLQEGQSLYLAGLFSNPETVNMLNQNGMLDCSCLASTQEEADTRIILHALYSDKRRIFDSFQFYLQFVQIDMASFRLSLRIIQILVFGLDRLNHSIRDKSLN